MEIYIYIYNAGRIGELVSIHWDDKLKTVSISADGGRVCRPLIIVRDGKPRVTKGHIAELRAGFATFDDLLQVMSQALCTKRGGELNSSFIVRRLLRMR